MLDLLYPSIEYIVAIWASQLNVIYRVHFRVSPHLAVLGVTELNPSSMIFEPATINTSASITFNDSPLDFKWYRVLWWFPFNITSFHVSSAPLQDRRY